jgi:hypothetical protein
MIMTPLRRWGDDSDGESDTTWQVVLVKITLQTCKDLGDSWLSHSHPVLSCFIQPQTSA